MPKIGSILQKSHFGQKSDCMPVNVNPENTNVVTIHVDVISIYSFVSWPYNRIPLLFSNNVLDATKAFSVVLTNPEDVRGLPESLLQMTAQAAAAAETHTELKGTRFNAFLCSSNNIIKNF